MLGSWRLAFAAALLAGVPITTAAPSGLPCLQEATVGDYPDDVPAPVVPPAIACAEGTVVDADDTDAFLVVGSRGTLRVLEGCLFYVAIVGDVGQFDELCAGGEFTFFIGGVPVWGGPYGLLWVTFGSAAYRVEAAP